MAQSSSVRVSAANAWHRHSYLWQDVARRAIGCRYWYGSGGSRHWSAWLQGRIANSVSVRPPASIKGTAGSGGDSQAAARVGIWKRAEHYGAHHSTLEVDLRRAESKVKRCVWKFMPRRTNGWTRAAGACFVTNFVRRRVL